MKVWVIYDSMYGNTEKIAQAIGASLKSAAEVIVAQVAGVNPAELKSGDLLVVGSPTQAFGPIEGMKQFLKSLPATQVEAVKFAAFDTRMDVRDVNSKFFTFMVGIFGYAAEKIAKGLKGKGGVEVVPPAGFIVTGKEGPLRVGELERAAAWAGEILLHC